MTDMVYLTREEWDSVNTILPDVTFVCNRINGEWPYMDWISARDMDLLSRLRLAQVCFRDSSMTLRNARYALGHAVGVRKYYLDRSSESHDTSHVLADVYSRFYADYVALLLWSTGEHLLSGLRDLFGKTENAVDKYRKNKEGKRSARVTGVRRLFDTELASYPITEVIRLFDESIVRREIWKYRNDWVHNKPPRVETILHNLPRMDFILDDFPGKAALLGVSVPPDYLWNDLIEKLKVALVATAITLDFSSREWEREYEDSQK